ncbi:hypothetical protein CAEBREN_20044 [Caenorhabditis brenneri]|uniref:Uncharacterized protein n=1 Tax=Caenorhabditis brenneri TaxID=135651 RepID=G0NTS4_CAEBE|nr:hypothetical protein CAEBREN_20044 [Caenorhabditis brenneri]
MTKRLPRTKWKFRNRVVYTAIFFYLLYRTITFLHVLYLNYHLGSPLDFSELMVEKDPKKFLEDFIKFKSESIPFDFHQIAIENEKMLQVARKEFIRQIIGS